MRLKAIIIALVIQKVAFSQPKFQSNDLTERFAYEVHSIDVFFDRFNFKKNSVFLDYFIKTNPDWTPNRVILIKSLFNNESSTKSLNNDIIENFILNVTDSLKPLYLKYRDSGWYADIDCRVMYKGKPGVIKLVMTVERTSKSAYKWSVVSADAALLKNKKNRIDSLVTVQKNELLIGNDSSRYFLSPVSHGINFSNLFKFFENKQHVRDYLAKGAYSFELAKLVYLVEHGEVKFIQVNQITYHLMQLNGWGMTVTYFEGSPKNSGWLISKLTKLSLEEKNDYLRRKLNINPN